MAGRFARGNDAPGHRPDREEARRAGVARLHQERHRCRPNDRLRLFARHDEGCRRRADLGARAQHDCGHQGRFPARRHRAGLQRPLRRRVRQHLRFHQRRPEPAPIARSGRGHSRKGLDRPECRQGRHSRRAGRNDLPGIFDPEDRGARTRHPLHHLLAAGAKCRRALRRVPGGAGADQRAGQRPIRIRGKPEGDQSQGQRPVFPADRCGHHHARLRRSADDADFASTASPRSLSRSG